MDDNKEISGLTLLLLVFDCGDANEEVKYELLVVALFDTDATNEEGGGGGGGMDTLLYKGDGAGGILGFPIEFVETEFIKAFVNADTLLLVLLLTTEDGP